MTLLDDALAIARTLGLRSSVVAGGIVAILEEAANKLGFQATPKMTLPEIAAALKPLIGIGDAVGAPSLHVEATTESPAARAALPASGSGSSTPCTKSKRKRPLPTGLQTLFSLLPEAKKTKICADELYKQRELALKGEDYQPEVEDMRTFKSEITGTSTAPASVRKYCCSKCPRIFTCDQALTFHMLRHVMFLGNNMLRCDADVPGQQYVEIECGARRREGGHGPAMAARAAERAAEQNAEAVRRLRKRNAEDAPCEGEQRCGSGKRHQYSAKDQAEMVDIVNRIHGNPEITNKGDAWRDRAINPKYYGVAFSNTSKWRRPDEHRRILRAAAKLHAGSLLRIDAESRKKGRWAAMETSVFAKFRARRARGRKSSGRWPTAQGASVAICTQLARVATPVPCS